MGFRYRKSFNVGGGFRINVSKSGVGYSWGTKGFRVTQTSGGRLRKTYSVPGTGFSYVSETVSKRKRSNQCGVPISQSQDLHNLNTQHIQTAEISNFETTEANKITETIERTLRLNKWSKFLLRYGWIPPFWFCLIVGIILKIKIRESGFTELEYSFDDEKLEENIRHINAWMKLSECNGLWQIINLTKVQNKKVNAGASSSVERIPCTISRESPFYIKTNVEVVQIKLKNEIMVLLPDKLLIVRDNKVGSVDYKDLHISISKNTFIEDTKVPNDTQIIDYTWRFVNKDGTQDLRYKYNAQLPICQYGEVHITSNNGVNVIIQISNLQKLIEFGKLMS